MDIESPTREQWGGKAGTWGVLMSPILCSLQGPVLSTSSLAGPQRWVRDQTLGSGGGTSMFASTPLHPDPQEDPLGHKGTAEAPSQGGRGGRSWPKPHR